MKTCNVIFAAALAAIALPATAPAVAATPSIDVPVADLDLSQAADRAVLDSRIERAARKVCSSGMKGANAQRIESECRAQAVSNAARQADLAIASARETRFASITVDPGA